MKPNMLFANDSKPYFIETKMLSSVDSTLYFIIPKNIIFNRSQAPFHEPNMLSVDDSTPYSIETKMLSSVDSKPYKYATIYDLFSIARESLITYSLK